MKIKISFLVMFIMNVSITIAQVPQMVGGWPYLTRTEMWAVKSTPRFSFFDNLDSSAVFFNNVTFEIDKFHIDGSFYTGWPVIEDSVLFGRTPIIVDIDHDGKDEVVTVGARRSGDNHYLYSLLYMVDDDGSIMPGFPTIYYRPRALNVADLDGDGEYEIILFSVDEDAIFCIDRFGNSKPGWPVDLPEDVFYVKGAAIGDIDLDGNNEYFISGLYNIYAYRYDGSMQEGFPIPSYDSTYYYDYWGWGPVLADVDLDGYLEILISAGRRHEDWTYDSYAAVYEHTGEMKENWPLMFTDKSIWQTPIVADINNDNIPEIGFRARLDGYFVDINANSLPGWPASLLTSFSDIIIVDIDGDGDCEIFTDYNTFYGDSIGPDSTLYNGYSYLHCYDHLGQQLPDYPIVIHGAYLGRPPSFGYYENSHRVYMGLFTEVNLIPWEDVDTGYVEVYIFPDSTGPPDQWPMLGHDNLMTRNYNFVDNVTSIKDENKIIPKNYILKQNYPNPFNTSTMIEFSLPYEEHINLSVYDILGRRVDELFDGKLIAGNHGITWRSDDVSSGIYFFVLKTEKAKINRMMTILR